MTSAPGYPERLQQPTDPLALPPHLFALIWLLLAGLTVFALAVVHDLGLLQLVFAFDRSNVTMVIAGLVLLGSCHALWHVLLLSGRIEQASACLSASNATVTSTTNNPTDGFIQAWLHAVADRQPANDELLEVYADKLRSPAELGWFLVDTTIRLGLLGTIIGFILIFTSLSSVSIDGAEGLRDLLVAMSGGMGTALFTTLAGLIGATLLAIQYLILGREAEHLLGLLARLRTRSNH